jgi:hypothetical protein
VLGSRRAGPLEAAWQTPQQFPIGARRAQVIVSPIDGG